MKWQKNGMPISPNPRPMPPVKPPLDCDHREKELAYWRSRYGNEYTMFMAKKAADAIAAQAPREEKGTGNR